MHYFLSNDDLHLSAGHKQNTPTVYCVLNIIEPACCKCAENRLFVEALSLAIAKKEGHSQQANGLLLVIVKRSSKNEKNS